MMWAQWRRWRKSGFRVARDFARFASNNFFGVNLAWQRTFSSGVLICLYIYNQFRELGDERVKFFLSQRQMHSWIGDVDGLCWVSIISNHILFFFP